ncbi:MAG TPA: TetR/AcrR family transcriptional regulator, partial [Gemmatimonadaceae bacterium]|nr:TetR/AcrR family transcriptional regulator [Gemmatimonadaceae bacterium]
MSIPYVLSGRTRQKSRTRDALIDATRQLIAEGLTPTVEDAAAQAGISRTTAYRYFSNQRAILIAAHPEIERKSLLGANPSRDPAERLGAVLDEFFRIMLETEPQLRMALRLSLEHGSAPNDNSLRRGRAVGWIEDALAPLAGKLSKQEIRKLALAIRSAAGIEALVWLTDVGRLSRAQAVEIMRSSALALLSVAVGDR